MSTEIPAEQAPEQGEVQIESSAPVDQGGFPATRVLVTLNVLLYVAMGVTSGGVAFQSPTSEMLIQWGANFGPLSLNGEWWRIVSSMFLHIGFFHIAFNMAALWNLGEFAERLFGTPRFLNLYFLSGLGGSCLSLLGNPGAVSAGASGAIFGVYGALFAFFFARRKEMGSEAFRAGSKSATAFILINVVMGLVFGFDNFCHAGGLITGFICGTLYLPRPARGIAVHPVFGTAIIIGAIIALFQYAEKVPFDFFGSYHASLARHLLRADRYTDALAALQTTLKKKPDNTDALFLSGYAYLKLNRMPESLAAFERVVALDPKDAKAVELRDILKAELQNQSVSKPILHYKSK